VLPFLLHVKTANLHFAHNEDTLFPCKKKKEEGKRNKDSSLYGYMCAAAVIQHSEQKQVAKYLYYLQVNA